MSTLRKKNFIIWLEEVGVLGDSTKCPLANFYVDEMGAEALTVLGAVA